MCSLTKAMMAFAVSMLNSLIPSESSRGLHDSAHCGRRKEDAHTPCDHRTKAKSNLKVHSTTFVDASAHQNTRDRIAQQTRKQEQGHTWSTNCCGSDGSDCGREAPVTRHLSCLTVSVSCRLCSLLPLHQHCNTILSVTAEEQMVHWNASKRLGASPGAKYRPHATCICKYEHVHVAESCECNVHRAGGYFMLPGLSHWGSPTSSHNYAP